MDDLAGDTPNQRKPDETSISPWQKSSYPSLVEEKNTSHIAVGAEMWRCKNLIIFYRDQDPAIFSTILEAFDSNMVLGKTL